MHAQNSNGVFRNQLLRFFFCCACMLQVSFCVDDDVDVYRTHTLPNFLRWPFYSFVGIRDKHRRTLCNWERIILFPYVGCFSSKRRQASVRCLIHFQYSNLNWMKDGIIIVPTNCDVIQSWWIYFDERRLTYLPSFYYQQETWMKKFWSTSSKKSRLMVGTGGGGGVGFVVACGEVKWHESNLYNLTSERRLTRQIKFMDETLVVVVMCL